MLLQHQLMFLLTQRQPTALLHLLTVCQLMARHRLKAATLLSQHLLNNSSKWGSGGRNARLIVSGL